MACARACVRVCVCACVCQCVCMIVNELNSACREGLHIIYYDFPLFDVCSSVFSSNVEGASNGCEADDLQGTSDPGVLGLVDNMEDCSLQWSVWYGHSFQHLNSSQGISFGGLDWLLHSSIS